MRYTRHEIRSGLPASDRVFDVVLHFLDEHFDHGCKQRVFVREMVHDPARRDVGALGDLGKSHPFGARRARELLRDLQYPPAHFGGLFRAFVSVELRFFVRVFRSEGHGRVVRAFRCRHQGVPRVRVGRVERKE